MRCMVEVLSVFLLIAGILIFGFLGDLIFQRYNIPDILFLILLGMVLQRYVTGSAEHELIVQFAPLFTTFALVFLIYDGAFNINLESFAKGIGPSMLVTLLNFITSVFVVTLVARAFALVAGIAGFGWSQALLMGFILGGVSSAFVIPVIKKIALSKDTYSILTLESAMTDVFCIVSSLTMMEIIQLSTFNLAVVAGKITTLFAVAGFMGILAGMLWIFLTKVFFRENKSYMITLAYLLLLYVVTELLGGNGAIAALFFGLVLKNSRQLMRIGAAIMGSRQEHKALIVTSQMEQFFYSQISFLLKTFFFVFIGLQFNFHSTKTLVFGLLVALAVGASRQVTFLLTKKRKELDQKISASIFARGLAAAAIAQFAIDRNLFNAGIMLDMTYAAIIFTILFSSLRIFQVLRAHQQPVQ